jgi:hypothetical protein
MIKWEYKTMFGSISDITLNELGNEGWELFAIEPSKKPVTYLDVEPFENVELRRFYFKRAIQKI